MTSSDQKPSFRIQSHTRYRHAKRINSWKHVQWFEPQQATFIPHSFTVEYLGCCNHILFGYDPLAISSSCSYGKAHFGHIGISLYHSRSSLKWSFSLVMLNDLIWYFFATSLNSKQQDAGTSITQSHWVSEEFALPFFLRLFPNMMWESPGGVRGSGEVDWERTKGLCIFMVDPFVLKGA